MEITLKFRHLQFIAFHLRGKSIGTPYFKMFMEMSHYVDENTQDEDEVTIEVEPGWIEQVWQLLGNKSEKESSVYNSEISDLVEKQLGAIIAEQPNQGITIVDGEEVFTPERQLVVDLEIVKQNSKDRVDKILSEGKKALLL